MGVKVKLPDGNNLKFEKPVSAADVAMEISPRLAKAAVAAEIDGQLTDISTSMDKGEHEVKIITNKDEASLEILRHTAAHVMAQAVVNLLGPEVKYTIGPALMDDFQYGFYYDFDLPRPIGPEDLIKIEAEMKKIASQKIPLERIELSVDEAKAKFNELGQGYKNEMIDDLVRDEGVTSVSLYRQGEFLDMCRGPHLPDTSKVKAFKLITSAGAYWRGRRTPRRWRRPRPARRECDPGSHRRQRG